MRQGGEIHRFEEGLGAARFEARDVEQGVDQLVQAVGVALHQLELRALRGRQAAVHAVEQIGGRREHQHQRRAEFVAHVAEEAGLGAVQRRQRLDARPLFLECARRADRGFDLIDGEAEHPAIALVENPHRAEAGHEEPVRLGLAGRGQAQDRGLAGWRFPAPLRQRAETLREVVDHDEALLRARRGERPALRRGLRDRTRVRRAFVAIEAGRRDQLGVVPSRAHEVDQREGDIRVVAPEHPGRRPAGRRDRLGLDPFRAEVPEHLQLAFVLDRKRRLVTRRQDAADRPRVVADRTVRKREVGFFEESLSVHREQEVLVPDPALSLEDVGELRADDGPDLRPDDRCGLPERGRVLGAQDRDVAVVVKVEEVRPPEQRHREPVLEHHRRRGPAG